MVLGQGPDGLLVCGSETMDGGEYTLVVSVVYDSAMSEEDIEIFGASS